MLGCSDILGFHDVIKQLVILEKKVATLSNSSIQSISMCYQHLGHGCQHFSCPYMIYATITPLYLCRCYSIQDAFNLPVIRQQRDYVTRVKDRRWPN